MLRSCSFLLVFASASFGQDSNALQEKVIRAAVAKVAPTIVMIETSGGQDVVVGGGIRKVAGPTTGMIVSEDGLVMTSTFNFANSPSDIFITYPGKGRFVAKAVGIDMTRMLTLLKPQGENTPKGLPVPVPVPRKEIAIGQWAIACGRTIDNNIEHTPSMSSGIISALNRVWGKAVQTDAKVSPVNYGGPLVAIDGRVHGILVPASPQGQDEKAGVEWYDSGIGFAIPLEDVLAAVPKMKDGTPEKPIKLLPGLIGITPKTSDMYADLPVVGTVAADSSAQKAGMLPGDQIVEIDGKAVVNFAQLQTILKPKYAGDTVNIKVSRKGKDLTFDKVLLQGTVKEISLGYMGVLPMRDDPEPGVEVRFVFPDSPAEKAGIKAGDRIMKLAPKGVPQLGAFSGRDQFCAIMNTLISGTEMTFEVKRKEGGKTDKVEVTLIPFPDTMPEKIPDTALSTAKKAKDPIKAVGAVEKKEEPKKEEPKKDEPKKDEPKKKEEKEPERGLIKRKIDVANRSYWMWVPRAYEPNVSFGLIVWLHPAGIEGRDADDMSDLWAFHCRERNTMIVAPISQNKNGWVASESGSVIETIRDVMNEYTIDKQRIVVHGSGSGGQMAYYMGFAARDLIRGVAVHGAPLGNNPKDNISGQKLQFYIVAGDKDPLITSIKLAKPTLKDKKFPVFENIVPNFGKQYLDDELVTELSKWIDLMDRQ